MRAEVLGRPDWIVVQARPGASGEEVWRGWRVGRQQLTAVKHAGGVGVSSDDGELDRGEGRPPWPMV